MKPIKEILPASTDSPPARSSDCPLPPRKTVKDLKLPNACPECGGSGYFRQDLPVDHPKFGQIVECVCRLKKQAQQQQTQLEGWLARARFKNYRTSDANRAALAAVRAFADAPRAWLTLWGGYGPGKTHLLAAAINACRARGCRADYYTLPDLLDQLRRSYKSDCFEALFESLCTMPVLALDEVDRINLTGWAGEKAYQLIEARYRGLEERATLFALNQDPGAALKKSQKSELGYLFSRMFDEHSQVIHLAAADARPMAKSLWSDV